MYFMFCFIANCLACIGDIRKHIDAANLSYSNFKMLISWLAFLPAGTILQSMQTARTARTDAA